MFAWNHIVCRSFVFVPKCHPKHKIKYASFPFTRVNVIKTKGYHSLVFEQGFTIRMPPQYRGYQGGICMEKSIAFPLLHRSHDYK